MTRDGFFISACRGSVRKARGIWDYSCCSKVSKGSKGSEGSRIGWIRLRPYTHPRSHKAWLCLMVLGFILRVHHCQLARPGNTIGLRFISAPNPQPQWIASDHSPHSRNLRTLWTFRTLRTLSIAPTATSGTTSQETSPSLTSSSSCIKSFFPL